MKTFPLIDILKFVSALSIISIHTQPMLGVQDSVFYFLYLWLQCFAIPFFFVSSAFLFFSKTQGTAEGINGGGIFQNGLSAH
jgi:peptidoglycan/LPS O-acetylase OafA/YrhL